MKKFFAIVAVVMFAVAANAEVLFQETFCARRIDSKTGEPGSTYIVKAKTSSGDAWPYASQWFEGYTGLDKGSEVAVSGNQYDNDYTAVSSYSVSIRGKKLNGSSDSSVGLYFSASKTADNNYVKFEGALPEIPEGGAYLHFEICSTEANGGDLDVMVVKVNDAAVTVPSTTLGNQYSTSTVTIALAAGQMESLYFAFNNVPSQKFISKFWIDQEAQGIENIVLTEKAQKVMVDGVVYVIRDNKMYNALGTQVR